MSGGAKKASRPSHGKPSCPEPNRICRGNDPLEPYRGRRGTSRRSRFLSVDCRATRVPEATTGAPQRVTTAVRETRRWTINLRGEYLEASTCARLPGTCRAGRNPPDLPRLHERLNGTWPSITSAGSRGPFSGPGGGLARRRRLSSGWTLHVVAGGTPARFGRPGAAHAAGVPWRCSLGPSGAAVTGGVVIVQPTCAKGGLYGSLSAISASKPSRHSILGSLSTTNGANGGIFRSARSPHNEPARCSASHGCGGR
jgi:hypothetical protein